MSSAVFGIQAIKVNGTAFIGGRGQSLDRGRQILSAGFDGQVFETLHTAIQTKPVMEFETAAIKTMITALGTSGTTAFPLVVLDGAAGIVMYCGRSAVDLPGYDASSIHVSRTALNGVLVMERLSWSLGQPAVMHLKAFLTSTDGTTDPITTATNVALASLPAAANTEAYALSALTINGTSLGPVNSMELTVGHKFDFDYLTGLPYPTLVSGAGARGPAEIRMSVDMDDISLGEGTGSVSAVFTNLANGGTLGSSTVTATMNGPWSLEDGFQGQFQGPMTRRLTVRPKFAGATNPFTWATT